MGDSLKIKKCFGAPLRNAGKFSIRLISISL